MNYKYTAVEYSRRKYTTGSAVIETGKVTLPDFKTAEEAKSYLSGLRNKGCCAPFCGSHAFLDEIEMVDNGFDVHTCNSIVVSYRKEGMS